MSLPERTRFLEKMRFSLEENAFVKLTFSQPRNPDAPENLYVRLVELKTGVKLSCTFRYRTRDVTKNFELSEAMKTMEHAFEAQFDRANLLTTNGDWRWHRRKSGEETLASSRPTITTLPTLSHDQEKKVILPPQSTTFLNALGVTNRDGDARPGMADKLRQIQRFVEIFSHLLEHSTIGKNQSLRVVDMGAGKGYLTFAVAEYLRQRNIVAKVTGIEARPDLVEFTERAARELGFDGLHFECSTIERYSLPDQLDVLIALHACDTATDDALFRAITANAALIITAPCCQKEVRAEMGAPAVLGQVLRHGILREREAEIVTDGLRALCLEIRGYKASVFEFISNEHTGKNLMIAAERREQPRDPEPLIRQLHELMDFYGLRRQRLVELLKIGALRSP